MADLPPPPTPAATPAGGPTVDRPPSIRQTPRRGDRRRVGRPLIRLRGVTKSYDTGGGPFAGCRDVDLSVRAGAFVAIVGPLGETASRPS